MQSVPSFDDGALLHKKIPQRTAGKLSPLSAALMLAKLGNPYQNVGELAVYTSLFYASLLTNEVAEVEQTSAAYGAVTNNFYSV